MLTSRNFLSNPETSKNIEMLEQRILMSDNNDETADRHCPQSKITHFLTEEQEHTFTPTAGPTLRNSNNEWSHNESAVSRPKAMHSPRSRMSSGSARSCKQAFDYRTIFLLLGILLGINLILNAML